jgi:hypothetical protein
MLLSNNLRFTNFFKLDAMIDKKDWITNYIYNLQIYFSIYFNNKDYQSSIKDYILQM